MSFRLFDVRSPSLPHLNYAIMSQRGVTCLLLIFLLLFFLSISPLVCMLLTLIVSPSHSPCSGLFQTLETKITFFFLFKKNLDFNLRLPGIYVKIY